MNIILNNAWNWNFKHYFCFIRIDRFAIQSIFILFLCPFAMFLTATKSNLKELWTIHTTKYVIFVQKQKQGDSVFITLQVTKLFLICVYCIRVVINWSLPVMSLLILSIIEFIRKIYDYSYEENKTDWNLINFDDPFSQKKLKGISY